MRRYTPKLVVPGLIQIVKSLRKSLLERISWRLIARLGAGAFETISGEVVNVILIICSNTNPLSTDSISLIDISKLREVIQKQEGLQKGAMTSVLQQSQLKNPDARISLEDITSDTLLGDFADAYAGICSGDYARFGRSFWELSALFTGWEFQQTTVPSIVDYGGKTNIFLWEKGSGRFAEYVATLNGRLGGSWRRGGECWGKKGVLVSSMGKLPATIYTGELFDNNTAVILPKNPAHLQAIWAFCASTEFSTAVRQIDQKMNVTNATLVKVPFDLTRWQKVAEDIGPLPEPHSDDPTQWLFNGRPAGSDAPLQVAVARLLGYRWPQQEYDGLDLLADEDGIVCLPPVARELPAEERLRELLAKAHGAAWGAPRRGCWPMSVRKT